MTLISQPRSDRRPTLHALHVEDDDIDARVVQVIAGLSEWDLRITRVRSIREARDAMRNESFDIYIVDFWLDDECSLKLIVNLERLGRSAILLSNVASHEVNKFRLDSGHARFLSKSDFSPASFAAVVRSVLAQPLRESVDVDKASARRPAVAPAA